MPQGIKPSVIKIGGALLNDPALLTSFWEAVTALRKEVPTIIVHGGGPQVTAVAKRIGHTSRMVHGRRVTTDTDLEIVKWTLCGSLNKQLVAEAQRHGLRAVGLSGADGGLVQVAKRPPWVVDGEEVDFGWVGDVLSVHPEVIEVLLGAGFVPVLAPLGIDEHAKLYNVNADTVARQLAEAVGARELLLVTEAGHVKRNLAARAHLSQCDPALFEEGKNAGWIQDGMRVKLQVAFEALQAGVEQVFILHPGDLHQRTHATRVVL